jgi:hypothetical protein
MILLEIDPPSVAVNPLESDAPRTVDVNAVSPGPSSQAMKAEPG